MRRVKREKMKVGFVGMGVMGAPMAGHLLTQGEDVTVWNRTPSKALPLQEKGAKVAQSLEELGKNCDLIFICVGRTEDVQSCLDKLTASAKPGTIFVDHSTISPTETKAIHQNLNEQGFKFLDAPITGGSMGAQNGTLTIFCGGTTEVYEAAKPYMAAYAKRSELVGGPGAGQMMKMANQIAVGGALIGLCESLAFAQKAGLDLALTRDMVGSGAAGSWAFENYGPQILNQNWAPGFSIDNQVKDFGYCLESAEQLNTEIPLTELVKSLLEVLQNNDRGGDTTAALFQVLTGEVKPT